MNNFKVFKLNQRQIIALLSRGERLPDVVEIPTCRGIPEGATAHHLFHTCGGMSIGVVVSHESFPEVPEGEDPPEGEVDIFFNTYCVYNKHGLLPTDKKELEELLKEVQMALGR